MTTEIPEVNNPEGYIFHPKKKLPSCENLWELAYDDIFEGKNEDNAHYHEIIPTMDIEPFKIVLELIIYTINNADCDYKIWDSWKWELMKTKDTWGVEVFDWKQSIPTKLCVNIKWELLEDDPCRYFLVYMVVANSWGLEKLHNAWELLHVIAYE